MKRKMIYGEPDLFEQEAKQWLTQARIIAQRIAFETGSVSSDDIRRECPIPKYVSANTAGKIFCLKNTFQWNGVKKSKSPSRKGGMISVWVLTDNALLDWMSHYSSKVG